MEGDNTSNIDTINHMLTRRREGYDVVLASPYLYSGKITQVDFFRVILSQVANTMVKLVLGIKGILTFSSFFRLYNGRTILKLQQEYGQRIIYCTGFEAMVELLAKLVRMEARISEVESSVDWSKRAGKSKMKIIKTVFGYFYLFLNWRKLSQSYQLNSA
jgi:dolichol-phosphate mannosyltransferase